MKILGKGIITQQAKLKQGKSTTLLLVSVACAVVVFCLVATKTLLSEAAHQRRVLSGKHDAVNQLKANLAAINTLSNQMQALNNQTTNIIGGNSTGTGPNDGSNLQIVLDALPNQYDFPGLTASVEKLLSARSVRVDSISGKDDEAANITQPQANPQPVPINFSFSATTSYAVTQKIFSDFHNSIRPFHIVTIDLSGTDSRLSVTASINTYYQPTKTLSITSTEIK